MPASANTINLLSSKAGLSPQIELIQRSIKRISSISVVVFLLAAVSVGGLYYYYTTQQRTLEAERDSLRNQIRAASINEGLLISIKDRTRIVERAMTSQRPWGDMLDLLGTIATPPALSSISVEEDNKIKITIQSASINEIAQPVEQLIAYAKEGKIRNPELTSVQFEKDGLVSVSIAFVAVF
jgi:hypothetical protein